MNTEITYTPRHAKPGSCSDTTTTGGHGTATVTAPSIGRHAAPEGLLAVPSQGGKKRGRKGEHRRRAGATA